MRYPGSRLGRQANLERLIVGVRAGGQRSRSPLDRVGQRSERQAGASSSSKPAERVVIPPRALSAALVPSASSSAAASASKGATASAGSEPAKPKRLRSKEAKQRRLKKYLEKRKAKLEAQCAELRKDLGQESPMDESEDEDDWACSSESWSDVEVTAQKPGDKQDGAAAAVKKEA